MKYILFFAFLFFQIGCNSSSQKITIWHTETDPNASKILLEMAKNFEKQNPNLKIETEAIAWGDLSTKLTTALASGTEPDIVHLQPFMVASLYSKNLLEPIDDVIKFIGEDDIYPSVRDLQKFNGKYYGIAYAIGTTYFSYRKDWSSGEIPKTWDEYISLLSKIETEKAVSGITLPGKSSFFMDQLFAELVASNGGRLFDQNGNPTFTEKEVLETLDFLKKLSDKSIKNWNIENYMDQFKTFATGSCFSVPVTYARASLQIEKDAPIGINNPEHFAVMEPPIGPSGNQSYSTIDCEPWVIFRSSQNIELAKEFLKTFYEKENYLKFCQQVPIHLTPILKSIAESEEYLNTPFLKKWKSWQDLSLKMINENRVRPILLIEDDDKNLPFLFELQGKGIFTNMIMDVCLGRKSVEEAAKDANKDAKKLIQDFNK